MARTKDYLTSHDEDNDNHTNPGPKEILLDPPKYLKAVFEIDSR